MTALYEAGADRPELQMSEIQGTVAVRLTPQEVSKLFDNSDGTKWPPVLSVGQAAALLGVPKSTLYEWHRFGRLNGCCRRRGNHLRFLRDRLIQVFFNGEDWK